MSETELDHNSLFHCIELSSIKIVTEILNTNQSLYRECLATAYNIINIVWRLKQQVFHIFQQTLLEILTERGTHSFVKNIL